MAAARLEGIFQVLNKYGLKVKQLVINNMLKAEGSDLWLTKARQQKNYIDIIYDRYSDLDIVEIPMFPYELRGLDRLQEVEKILFQ